MCCKTKDLATCNTTTAIKKGASLNEKCHIYLALCSNSQWSGPVVMLNAPG